MNSEQITHPDSPPGMIRVPFYEEGSSGNRIVTQNTNAYVLNNLYPASPHGHLLMLPKREVISPFELTDAELAAIFDAAKLMKPALDKLYQPNSYLIGWNIGRAGEQKADCAHLHIMGKKENFAQNCEQLFGKKPQLIGANISFFQTPTKTLVEQVRVAQRALEISGVDVTGRSEDTGANVLWETDKKCAMQVYSRTSGDRGADAHGGICAQFPAMSAYYQNYELDGGDPIACAAAAQKLRAALALPRSVTQK